MKLKTPIAALAAVLLGLGGVALTASSASAHTGDLNASAVCQTDGTYKVTYTLSTSQTDEAGVTNWKVGTSHFDGTPTDNTGLSGAIASVGTQTVTLGTIVVPGNSTSAPWAYAFTTWSPDGFTKGSDGGNIELAGTCKAPPGSVTINPVGSVFTCAAGTVVTPVDQDSKVKYALLPDGSRPTAGVPISLPAGVSLTIAAHLQAQYLVENGGNYLPADYSVTFTGASTNTIACHPPVACVLSGTHDTEGGDLPPVQGPNGLIFDGPTAVGQAKDIEYRVLSGNAQGIVGKTITYYGTSTVFPAQATVEVWRNGIAGADFATFSTNIDAADAHGTIDLDTNGTWYTSKIASGPGSLAWVSTGHSETYADLVANYASNTLASALSLHLQSNSPADAHSVVASLGSSCGSYNNVPTVPETTHRTTTVTTDPVCNVTGGGESTTTVTDYTTAPVWNSDTHSYDLVETVDEGYPATTTNEIGTDICPTHITIAPVFPTQTDFCGTANDVRGTAVDTDAYTIATVINSDGSADYTATAKDGYVFDESVVTTAHLAPLSTEACTVIQKVLGFTGGPFPWGTLFAGVALAIGGLLAIAYAIIRGRRKEVVAS